MKYEMPQNQGELDATLLVEDKKENLINNLASSWIPTPAYGPNRA